MLKRHEIQVLRRAEHTWREIATLSGVLVQTLTKDPAPRSVELLHRARLGADDHRVSCATGDLRRAGCFGSCRTARVNDASKEHPTSFAVALADRLWIQHPPNGSDDHRRRDLAANSRLRNTQMRASVR